MPEGMSGAAAGGQLEEKVDLSAETDAKLEQIATLPLPDSLAILLALEKKCRVGNDLVSLQRVCKATVEACQKDHDSLISTIQTLCSRRSQKSKAVLTVVQTAMPWCVVDEFKPLPVTTTEEKEQRDELVRTLRDITEGKLFLERERAHLTRALATIQEDGGDVKQAATVLQDVHVETYGSLSKREKVEFILEQMRLTLAARDFVRAAIVAGKVSKKNLAEMQDYKVQYYTLYSIYHRHEKNALALAQDYHAIYSTPTILADDNHWPEALRNTVLFLVLSPYGNEQQDLLHRIAKDVNLEKLPACEKTVKLFLTKEIIQYPTPHQTELESFPAFSLDDLTEHWHETFFRRIIQHNVRMAALYYKRIHGKRLAELLQLDPVRLEKEVASMASEGKVYVKVDRPKDIYRFAPPQNPESILTEWASDIDKILHLVETTTHLIHKEKMTS